LTAKATIETVSRCKKLSPSDIARLNNIFIPSENFSKVNDKIWPKNDLYWRKFHDLDMEMALGGFSNKMDSYEAMRILGFHHQDVFANRITWSDIRKRHKEMMMNNHPDKGGSKFIAMKINNAKEVLEKEFGKK
jgi:hypothetical protein